MNKGRLYPESFTGLFVHKHSGIAHSLHIGWFSASSRDNYWFRECGGAGIGFAGGDRMMDEGCHGPGRAWIDIRDFKGTPKTCQRCKRDKE